MAALTYLLYIICAIVVWIIFYYVVKAAVKHGIIEARAASDTNRPIENRKPEHPTNQKQIKLQQQYDKGEITFEVYQSEWNKS
jgi:hypothetical protein